MHCPICFDDKVLCGNDEDDLLNKGFYTEDNEGLIDCGNCGEKVKWRSYQSIDWELVAADED